ncbi:MAG: glycosyltransferase family 39 protein [Caldilineaceae bacterium]
MLKQIRWPKDYDKEYRFIFLIVFVSRLYRITWNPLWLDEAYSYQISIQNPLRIIQNSFYESHPPLYYLLLKLASIVSATEIGLRWFSALSAALALLAIYSVAKKLTNRWAALLTSLLLMISPEVLYFSQEARSYIIAMAVSAVTTLLVFQCSSLSDKQKEFSLPLLLWAGLSVLGLYIAYAYFLIVAIQSLYLLIIYQFRWRIITICVCMGITALPLLSLLVQNLSSDLARTSSTASLTWVIMIQALLAGDPIRYGVNWGTLVLPILFGMLIVIGIVTLPQMQRRFGFYLVAQLIIPLVLFFVIGVQMFGWHMPVFQSRQFIVILPSLFLLTSLGIQACIKVEKSLYSHFIFVCFYITMVLASGWGTYIYWTTTKSPEGLAVRYVQQHMSPADAIISLHYSLDGVASFYLRGNESVYAKPLTVDGSLMFSKNLLILRGTVGFERPYQRVDILKYPSFWIMYDKRRELAFLPFLSQGCTIEHRELFAPFEVLKVGKCIAFN